MGWSYIPGGRSTDFQTEVELTIHACAAICRLSATTCEQWAGLFHRLMTINLQTTVHAEVTLYSE